jgi:2,3-dihydroxyphenylpropionate 1,2-dioxygenase
MRLEWSAGRINRGQELLNWVALMGAMRGAPADFTAYEHVVEWIGGIAYAAYEER